MYEKNNDDDAMQCSEATSVNTNVNANPNTEKSVNKAEDIAASDPTFRYGWGWFKPDCLQKFMNNPIAFLLIITATNFIQGLVNNGLVKVVLTSLERRFNLQSVQSAMVVSTYDAAAIISLIPISFFGGQGNKPRWIGIGLIASGIGIIIFSLPHFVTSEYKIASTESEGLCRASSIVTVNNNSSEACSDVPLKDDDSNMLYVLMLAQFLNGLGGIPMTVLSVTYMDENVNPPVYPLYLGVYYLSSFFGPAFGFLVGTSMLQQFTEVGVVTPPGLTEKSEQWVGRWWLGFLVSGILTLFLTIPIMGFPENLPSKLTRKMTATDIDLQLEDESELKLAKIRSQKRVVVAAPAPDAVSNGAAVNNIHVTPPAEEKTAPMGSGASWSHMLADPPNQPISDAEVDIRPDSQHPTPEDQPLTAPDHDVELPQVAVVGDSRFVPESPAADIESRRNTYGGNPSARQSTASMSYSEHGERRTSHQIAAKVSMVLPQEAMIRTRPSLAGSRLQMDNDSDSGSRGVSCCNSSGLPTTEDFVTIMTNRRFLLLSLSAAWAAVLVSGFTSYGPKFAQSQFNMTPSEAATFFGLVCIPGAAMGLALGSVSMSVLKLSSNQAVFMCFSVSLFGFFAHFVLTVYCDVPLAGYTFPYPGGNESASGKYELLTECNRACNCPPLFEPVCAGNLTYHSACYAGCTPSINDTVDGDLLTYTNCACDKGGITSTTTNATADVVRAGKCEVPCKWRTLILLGLFLMIFSTFVCVSPGVDVTLRCFPMRLRSLAMGLQWLILRVLGGVPGPLIFGAIIDSSCVIWNKFTACSPRGSCAFYNNPTLSFKLLILTVIYKALSVISFGLAYHYQPPLGELQ